MNVEELFLDTNLLVYARDRGEPEKGALAQNLLQRIFAAGMPHVSTQVLSEFFWTVTRKLALPLTTDEAIAETRRLILMSQVLPLSVAVIEKALDAVARHSMPLWDAQIFAAARVAGAATVLSEDFQHRRTIEGITFLNPFADDFDPRQVLVS